MANNNANNNNKEHRSARQYFLVGQRDTPFAAKEAYKSARTNLIFLLKNQSNKKTVVFTSPLSGEGKTITCVNLAMTFAQSGSKTLIIDADMRKPQIHNALSVYGSPGLSELLAGFSDESCIQRTETENLSVLSAGTIPPNPSELLLSERFDTLLKQLSERYDYIFIDAPPVGVVTDAAIISGKGIPAVLEVRQNVTDKNTVVDARELLEKAGGIMLGYIFNDVASSGSGYGYRGKYGRKYGDYKYGYGRYGGYYSTDNSDKTEEKTGQ